MGCEASANQRRSIRLTTSAMCPVPLALGRPPHRPAGAVPRRSSIQNSSARRWRTKWRTSPGAIPNGASRSTILERALFFQPLNRLARARLCDSAEFLCDEWAVQHTQSPLALARCLSVVASWWSPADELAGRRQRHGKE